MSRFDRWSLHFVTMLAGFIIGSMIIKATGSVLAAAGTFVVAALVMALAFGPEAP